MTVNCDKIMALEDGKNMDEGIREELLSKNRNTIFYGKI